MPIPLSLCLIVKDEDADSLKEWVDYHTRIGVDAFIIYDNESRLPVSLALADEIASGGIRVHTISGAYMQDTAYTHCLHFYGPAYRWMGFIDADEFLYPKTCADLRDLLADYTGAGGLAVNWVLFGSSGHEKQPAGRQVDAFTRCCPPVPGLPELVKSIVQPARVINVQTPHAFHYKSGYGCVGEDHDAVEGAYRRASTQKIQLNHYVLRSREQYEQKLRRGRGDHAQSAYHRTAYFDEVDAACTAEESGIGELYRSLPPRRRPLFAPPWYVPEPDVLRPEQMDFLRFAAAAEEARLAQDAQAAARIRQIAAEKYPDLRDDPLPAAQAQELHASGWQALESGQLHTAGELFETALRRSPWDYAAWEGMLALFARIDGGHPL